MAIVISVSNHKGGVGKTTSVANIGAGLTQFGKKVLVLDLDPQANLTQSLGIDDELQHTIYGSLKGEYPLTPIHLTDLLDIIPSTLDLSAAELELSSEAGREFILSELLQPIKPNYDFIIIDCPPSLGLLTVNALTASDQVFIPLQAHYLPLRGLTKITEVIDKVQKRINKKLKIGGVFVTHFDQRKILNREIADSIHENFSDRVFDTKIRNNIALAEAPTAGLDIFRYNPKCNGAEDYYNLCKEILSTLEQK